MKKSLLFLTSVLFCAIVFAQNVPQGINYQAAANDINGIELTNQTLDVRFSVVAGNNPGTTSYQEIHSVTTNEFGLFTAIIGGGTPILSSFSMVDWGAIDHYLKVEIDDGNGFVDMGTTQLLSVPYALHAENPAIAAETARAIGAEAALQANIDANTLVSGIYEQTLFHDGTDWVASSALTSNGTTVRIGENSSALTDLYLSDKIYDWDNPAYYLDPNGTSIMANIETHNLYAYPYSQIEVQDELDMNMHNIVGVITPTSWNHVANKQYVDNQVSSLSGSAAWTRAGSTVHLANSGDMVGIGTLTPAAALDIHSNAGTGALIQFENSNSGHKWEWYTGGNIGNDALGLYDRTASEYRLAIGSNSIDLDAPFIDVYAAATLGLDASLVHINGGQLDIHPLTHIYNNLTVYGSGMFSGNVIAPNILGPSDRRFKKDINTIDNALSKVLKLRGVNYYWKQKEFPERNFNDRMETGLIAQEVEEIIPSIVFTMKDGYKTVEYQKLVALLIEAIKDQQTIINNQKDEMVDIRKELNGRLRVLEEILTTTSNK